MIQETSYLLINKYLTKDIILLDEFSCCLNNSHTGKVTVIIKNRIYATNFVFLLVKNKTLHFVSLFLGSFVIVVLGRQKILVYSCPHQTQHLRTVINTHQQNHPVLVGPRAFRKDGGALGPAPVINVDWTRSISLKEDKTKLQGMYCPHKIKKLLGKL